MLKIIVSKTEDAKSLFKKIESSKSKDITLVIPRGSRFGDEVSNFHALKEVATEMDKEIYIESVDEDVLALAKSNGWEAIHPLFQGSKKGSISDIVSKQPSKVLHRSQKSLEEAEEIDAHSAQKNGYHVGINEVGDSEEEVDEAKEDEFQPAKISPQNFSSSKSYSLDEEPLKNKVSLSKVLVSVIGLLVLFGGIYYLGANVFNRGEVTLQFKRDPWQKSLMVSASSASSKVDIFSQVVPAQVFTQPKNVTQFYPATAKKTVSEKATGRLTIYNAYSSQPQPLVAKTRFATADGKVYRLDNQVVVPGADIKDGKIIASSVVTTVTADQAGENYNIGPTDKLSVLGFKGTPKYDAFYGSLPEGTSGGFVGEKAVPSESDIASAKQKVSDLLKASFDSVVFQGIPSEFKVIDGASNFEITKISVNSNTNAEGNFSVIGEAKLVAIGFKESDLESMATQISSKESGRDGTRIEKPQISYSNVIADYSKGILKFTAEITGNSVQNFDGEKFKKEVAGKTANEVKAMFSNLKDLSSAKLNIKPFWNGRMPLTEDKIKVVVE